MIVLFILLRLLLGAGSSFLFQSNIFCNLETKLYMFDTTITDFTNILISANADQINVLVIFMSTPALVGK